MGAFLKSFAIGALGAVVVIGVGFRIPAIKAALTGVKA